MSNINTIIENLTSYLDIGSNDVECNKCCPECGEVYVFAGVDMFLQWANFMDVTGYPPIISETPCCYERCVTELYDYLGSEENVNIVLDSGIVEYSTIQGKSFTCLLLDFATANDLSGNDLTQLILFIADTGVIISCTNGNTTIDSIETWLKWAEAMGVPVITAENACCLTSLASVEQYLKLAEGLGWTLQSPPPA